MNNTLILSGKDVAAARSTELKRRIARFKETTGRAPGLAVILVGEDPASQVYVGNKVKKCAELGIQSFHHVLSATSTPAQISALIKELNLQMQTDGILLQLPLPKGLKSDSLIEEIDPRKDPDALTSANMGLLMLGQTRVAPCTPSGIMKMLEHYKISVAGQNAVVVGRSNIVGKPMAQLLLEANATVTMAHSKTQDLAKVCKDADILVFAAGKPKLFGKEFVKKGAVVIDVGIHRVDGKLCGDVKADELMGYASALTPVPGGVGPMTIHMLMENTVSLAEEAIL